jgi:hypothetical protein
MNIPSPLRKTNRGTEASQTPFLIDLDQPTETQADEDRYEDKRPK